MNGVNLHTKCMIWCMNRLKDGFRCVSVNCKDIQITLNEGRRKFQNMYILILLVKQTNE